MSSWAPIDVVAGSTSGEPRKRMVSPHHPADAMKISHQLCQGCQTRAQMATYLIQPAEPATSQSKPAFHGTL